jgi:hypothetical protein
MYYTLAIIDNLGNTAMMTIDTLLTTIDPASLPSDHLRALWYDLNGYWSTAHHIVQTMSDVNAMWIHAYLHRKEPDIWNAKYWYHNAGKPVPPSNLDFSTEASQILVALGNNV